MRAAVGRVLHPLSLTTYARCPRIKVRWWGFGRCVSTNRLSPIWQDRCFDGIVVARERPGSCAVPLGSILARLAYSFSSGDHVQLM